jgi:hypothetical protein
MKGRRIASSCTCILAFGLLPSGMAAQILVPKVSTAPLLADLVVAAVAAPSRVVPTVSFSLSVSGRNAGRASVSGSWTALVYLSRDSIVDTRDAPIGSPLVVPSGIEIGSTSTVSVPVTLPAATAAGFYYVGVVLDPANVIAESNEANNGRGDRVEVFVPAAPNVFSTVPANASKGAVNSALTFNGTGLEPLYFRATLGGKPLAILPGGSSSAITVTLPSTLMMGDLVVSHSVPSSDYTVRSGFIVYGRPSIASVSPASFRQGQTVTLSGSSLYEFNVWPTTWNNDGNKYVDIGGTGLPVMGSSRVRVTNWQVVPNGTSLTFVAQDVWTSAEGGAHIPANPQPASVSGPIRLTFDDPAQNNTLNSPSVTWMPVPLSVVSIVYPTWENSGNSATPPWLMTNFLNRSYSFGKLQVAGTSLTGVTATIGSATVSIAAGASTDGTSAIVSPPYGTPSGYLILVRGSERAQSAQPINVVRGPRLDPNASSPGLVLSPEVGVQAGVVQLKVDVTYTIRGWDLVPVANATGLTLRFESTTSVAGLQSCGLSFAVASHTANQIDFRFNKVGTVPESCLSTSTTTALHGVRLVASYGGVDRLWFLRALNLTQ